MELIKNYNEENLFKTQFTDGGMVILALLILSLVGLGERVLYDLARTFADPIGSFGYFNNPKVITVHAFFIIGLLILSIVVNYVFGRKREKYAIALIPYFITSIILAIQLALQLGVYFTNNHSNLQFYLVMSLLVIVSSYGIFHIQNNYKKVSDTSKANSTGLVLVFLAVFTIFAFLILSFNNNTQVRSNQVNNQYQNNNNNYYNYGAYNTIEETPKGNTDNINGVYHIDRLNNDGKVLPLEYGANVGNDNHPRIMYWYGKVNQHWDTTGKNWMTDEDGASGADIDKIEYCRKYYPDTVFTAPYKPETISTWRDAGNNGGYSATVYSDLCIKG